jgi:serine/threonine protein phosphatase PrpC
MTVLRSGSASDVGRVRAVNEDRALETLSLYAVADGMGGHAGGEVAARTAIDALQAAFSANPTGEGLVNAVRLANAAVWRRSLADPDLRGMGTTLTAAALVAGQAGDRLVLANVGDSRAYRFNSGTLEQLTTDHSVAEELLARGELTEAEAAVHPHRHILTRALGIAPDVDIDVWEIEPEEGDRYLLCSDGLSNEVPGERIAEALASAKDPQEIAEELVALANAHGGSDNVTAVVVDVVVGDRPPGAAMAPDVFVSASDGEAANSGATTTLVKRANDGTIGSPGTADSLGTVSTLGTIGSPGTPSPGTPSPGTPGPGKTGPASQTTRSAQPDDASHPEGHTAANARRSQLPPLEGTTDRTRPLVVRVIGPARVASADTPGADARAGSGRSAFGTERKASAGAERGGSAPTRERLGSPGALAARPSMTFPAPSDANRSPSHYHQIGAGLAFRPPRHVNLRVVLFVLVVAAVLAGAWGVVNWYVDHSYYVGLRNDQVVIFEGRPGGFLWFHPHVVEATGVTTAEVLPYHLAGLRSGVQEPSLAAARSYVENLRSEEQSAKAAGSPAGTSATSGASSRTGGSTPSGTSGASGTPGSSSPPSSSGASSSNLSSGTASANTDSGGSPGA